jgi:hypothetical protein
MYFQILSNKIIMAEGNTSAFTASSFPNDDVNEQFLANLIEMGIDKETARQVFYSTKDKIHISISILGFKNC